MTNEITKLKAEIEMLQAENLELKEKLIDYQKFVRIVNAKMAMDALEDWFNDDDDDDEYTSDNGELNNGTYGLTK